MRFAVKGNVQSPDGKVALAMMRLLIQYMRDNGMIRPKDIEHIRQLALDEIGNANNESDVEARRLINEQFP